jgi:hypothetical protein
MEGRIRASLAAAASALVFVAVACSDTVGPADEYVLPPPNSSLDPAALRLGEVLYACGRWGAGGRPAAERVLVDLFFGRRSADDPPDQPLPASLDAVRARGARILFGFAFPAVRVRIDTREIPPLVDSGIVNHARTVPDARRYDWQATVGYRRPLTASDSATFLALGGRVTYVFRVMPAISGELPNSSIAVFRQMPDVEYAEAAGVGCRAADLGVAAARSTLVR